MPRYNAIRRERPGLYLDNTDPRPVDDLQQGRANRRTWERVLHIAYLR